MRTMWLIQSSGVTTNQPHANIEALNKLGYEWKDFGLIPFTNEITNLENILEEDTNYILLGSTKMLTIFNEVQHISELCPYLTEEQKNLSSYYLHKLKSGIFYDINHFDQSVYKNYNLPLLNSEAQYIPVLHNEDVTFNEDMFIKPSRDLKAFNGGILEANTSINEYIMNQNHQSFYIDETVIIAPLQNIKAEYRFFVVSGKVITGSYYRKHNRAFKSRRIIQHVFSIAQEYAKLYAPAHVFTMDIAEMYDGTFKIIEYNCWNSSGSYDCNLEEMYKAVDEYVNLRQAFYERLSS